MAKRFIKKEGLALTLMARYLLGEQPGNRLKTIDELSDEFALSVGVVQNALKSLEQSQNVLLERRGRNGTLLTQINLTGLLQQADFGNLVCAMPLPYTKLYEGLASGLKEQFTALPLYFAHMRGAQVRIECLLDGVYDMAVVSRLAAESVLQQGQVRIALALGAGSYVDRHQLICRQGERAAIQRVGLDPRSPDQALLTNIAFAEQNIERVATPYTDCLAQIAKGHIDAVIWNVTRDIDELNLETWPLSGDERYQQASEAVVLTRNDSSPLGNLLQDMIDKPRLLAHQRAVQSGEIEPQY